MTIDRKTAAHQGQEIARILVAGHYVAPSGASVDISNDVRVSREATRSIRFDAPLPSTPPRSRGTTTIEVTGESTLAASRRLFEQHGDVCALNFASAHHAGGGFLSGARAQEESLARSSALFACLEGDAMYAFHASPRDPMYSDWAIHSPRVPVLRDEAGSLLERRWPCSFITCAAVNAKVVLERDATRGAEIERVMSRRIARVLDILESTSDRHVVLGAWGCGVFGNDTKTIARLFAEGLAAREGAFDHVVFAILDTSPEQRFRGPFVEALAGAAVNAPSE
ncbi:MAG: TIGR02452 family protein [Deltaproteobacteria bacterium]|nr:TIGR02452 family protein [Deltaproteobacteria bacterium]